MLDGELVGPELVGAFVGIGAGLGHVEAEDDVRSLDRIVADLLVGGPGVTDEAHGCGQNGGAGCSGDERAAARKAATGVVGHGLRSL